MANKIDFAPVRLEAARNLGLTAAFRRRWGRDFTGSRDDYNELNQAQQFRLFEEVDKLLKARRAAEPEAFTVSQAAAIERLGARAPEFRSVPSLIAESREKRAVKKGSCLTFNHCALSGSDHCKGER